MANSSRLKAIENALLTTIDAGTDATTTITRGHPGDNLTREAVWIGNVRFGERAAALSPQTPRRQQITYEIIVRVSQQGDDFPTLRDRAYTIADQVEEAIHADVSVAGSADFGGIEGGEVDSWLDTDGRAAAIALDATFTARRD